MVTVVVICDGTRENSYWKKKREDPMKVLISGKWRKRPERGQCDTDQRKGEFYSFHQLWVTVRCLWNIRRCCEKYMWTIHNFDSSPFEEWCSNLHLKSWLLPSLSWEQLAACQNNPAMSTVTAPSAYECNRYTLPDEENQEWDFLIWRNLGYIHKIYRMPLFLMYF